jgi:hypothetical protein
VVPSVSASILETSAWSSSIVSRAMQTTTSGRASQGHRGRGPRMCRQADFVVHWERPLHVDSVAFTAVEAQLRGPLPK